MSTKNAKPDNHAGSDRKQNLIFIQYYISMVSNEYFDIIKHYKYLLPVTVITKEGLKI